MTSHTHTNIPTAHCRIIAVACQKGGVGKTTTAVNLATGLAHQGHRVLLIDMDPQANTTFAALGGAEARGGLDISIYDFLRGDASFAEAVVSTAQQGLDVLPADIELSGAEVELQRQPGTQTRLRTRLKASAIVDYDVAVIDTPPSLGVLTINALAAATEVIVPIQGSAFALKGVEQLEQTIAQVREYLEHPRLRISGVLCTKFDYTNVSRDVLAALRAHFGSLVFQTQIPVNVKIEEAHSRSQSLYDYAPHSKGAQAYQKFVSEVLSRKEVATHA